ncbi:hypothetical protein Leryth_013020 [Lithospermum erythrorhizon]|nr:hypothetical protein Leryth_013020 [Lithospermum erythrorhizon]
MGVYRRECEEPTNSGGGSTAVSFGPKRNEAIEILVAASLQIAMSPRLTRRVPSQGSTGTYVPDLFITSRPPTFSSSCSIVKNPESV